MNNNIKIAVIISVVVLIVFFSYFLYFSPMAQCVNMLKDSYPKADNDALKLVCMKEFGVNG